MNLPFQIPEKDPAGNEIPRWKREMLAKKVRAPKSKFIIITSILLKSWKLYISSLLKYGIWQIYTFSRLLIKQSKSPLTSEHVLKRFFFSLKTTLKTKYFERDIFLFIDYHHLDCNLKGEEAIRCAGLEATVACSKE